MATSSTHAAPLRVVITGANRGIGLGLAKRAAELGHAVIGTARDPSRAGELATITGAAGRVRVEALDTASEESCRALAERLAGVPIDVVINNAGVFPDHGKGLIEFDASAYAECLRTNAIGPLLVTRALLPGVRAGRKKLVLQISSTMGSIASASKGANRGNLAYHASKAALNMATVLVASELRDDGVACVCMCPGWVRTDMGGANAHLAPMESASAIWATIDRLGLADSGRFINREGVTIPW
jgi:NAD(P)-dependent dehydrogenase (short-subunit alcohol dehydrogenase family)